MSAGEPVWLLPGLICDAIVWRDQADRLSACHDVSIAGFYGFNSIPAMARSVLERAPARFALAGHSMGGRVAMEIVRLAPERVSRLMLLDTGYRPRLPGEAEKRQMLVDLARAEGMEVLAAVWLPPMVHPDRLGDKALMTLLTDMVCRASPDIFAGQVRALLERPDAGAGLAYIRCPTTLLCGLQDGWSPAAQHEEMRQAIPGATLTIIKDSGHMTTVEQPAAVTAAMERWLAA